MNSHPASPGGIGPTSDARGRVTARWQGSRIRKARASREAGSALLLASARVARPPGAAQRPHPSLRDFSSRPRRGVAPSAGRRGRRGFPERDSAAGNAARHLRGAPADERRTTPSHPRAISRRKPSAPHASPPPATRLRPRPATRRCAASPRRRYRSSRTPPARRRDRPRRPPPAASSPPRTR